MSTPADLGLVTPGPNDLIRDGAGNITTNAQAVAELWDKRFPATVLSTTNPPHLDTLRTPGSYGVRNNDVAAAIGMPEGRAGTVLVEYSGNPEARLTIQHAWCYVGSVPGGKRFFRASSDFSGGWSDWQQVWPLPDPPDPTTSNTHAVRVSDALRRRGGPIGTAGRAVVALRFDHGLANFRDKVLPELRRLHLPWSIAINSDRWHIAENGGVTPADLQTWAHETGGEVWNHGRTHGDASTLAGLRTEIVDGLRDLQDQVPRLEIEGWIVPGVGGTGLGGFGGGSTPAQWDTTAGRLILDHHAFSTGHQAGRLRALYGTPQIGAAHRGIDSTTTAAPILADVDAAIAARAGLTLMLHPSLLDTAGQITLPVLRQVLEYLAARRDAGDLVVLPMTGLEVADARTHTSHQLIRLTAPASVAAGGTLTRTLDATNTGQHRGIPLAVEVDVEGGGAVTVTVAGAGAVTFPAGTGRRTLRRWVTIPNNQTSYQVTVSPSTAATVHQLHLGTGPTAPPPPPTDTGWRNITANFATLTSGRILVRRIGKEVFLNIDQAVFSEAGTFTASGAMPDGFRPALLIQGQVTISAPSVSTLRLTITTGGPVTFAFYQAAGTLRGSMSWPVDQDWPTTLPGTPA